MEYEVIEGQWLSEGRAILAGPGSNSFDDAIRTKLRAGWRLWGGVQIAKSGGGGTNETVWQGMVKDGTPGQTDYAIVTYRSPYRPAWHKGTDRSVADYLKEGWVPFGDPSCTTTNTWQALVKVAQPSSIPAFVLQSGMPLSKSMQDTIRQERLARPLAPPPTRPKFGMDTLPPPTPGLLSAASTNDSMMGNVSEFKSLGRGRRRTQRRR